MLYEARDRDARHQRLVQTVPRAVRGLQRGSESAGPQSPGAYVDAVALPLQVLAIGGGALKLGIYGAINAALSFFFVSAFAQLPL